MLEELQLTPAEQTVVDAAGKGSWTNLGVLGERLTDGHDWGPERSVRAEVVVALAVEPARPGEPALRPLKLRGVRIEDTLDFRSRELQRPLVLHQCWLEDVDLVEARARHIDLFDCRVPACFAGRLETRGDLYLRRLVGCEHLDLSFARIGGLLSLRGTRITFPGGIALDGDELEIDGALAADGLNVEGETRLVGARIAREVDLRRARLVNPGGSALNATRLRVGEDLVCSSDDGHRFTTRGEVRVIDVKVGGNAILDGASLGNSTGDALSAARLRVSGNLSARTDGHGSRFETIGAVSLAGAVVEGRFVMSGAMVRSSTPVALAAGGLVANDVILDQDAEGRPFTATAALDFRDARIASVLDMRDTRLTDTSGAGLDLERARVGHLLLPRAVPKTSTVFLTGAAVNRLSDTPGYSAALVDFRYDALERRHNDRAARLSWLRHTVDGYVPGAYDQLAAAYRRDGRDEEAKRVMIAKHVHRRSTLGLPGKAVSWLGAPVGYGYRTWVALVVLAGIIVTGWPIFDNARMTPLRAAAQLPDFHGLLYSLDAVLPVVNLGQETAWTPTGFAQGWYACSVLAGWLLGLGLVAFLTTRIFRE